MTNLKNCVFNITLMGEVFMYGQIQVSAIRNGEDVYIETVTGSDGAVVDENEKKVNLSDFEMLIEAISDIELNREQGEEINSYNIIEKESCDYKLWCLSLYDEDGNLVEEMIGTNNESEEFKKISNCLVDKFEEFSEVEKFFINLNN